MPITPWGDVRIPPELKELLKTAKPKSSLELGCGLGRFSRFVAQQGVAATAVDFSPVAIEKAIARAKDDAAPPHYLVGDVTKLDALSGPFDIAFDVGCFHCLDVAQERAYAAEMARLISPGGTLLIWALDESPSDLKLDGEAVRRVFTEFELMSAKSSRRRVIASHWYRLVRR